MFGLADIQKLRIYKYVYFSSLRSQSSTFCIRIVLMAIIKNQLSNTSPTFVLQQQPFAILI